MTQIQQIVFTSALTVCSGVVILALGEIIIRLCLEPLSQLRQLLGEISDSLTFYADVYSNPGVAEHAVMAEAKKVLRQRASQLWARSLALPMYGIFETLRLAPSKRNVNEAASNLIGLSNGVFQGNPSGNHDRAVAIRAALGLHKE